MSAVETGEMVIDAFKELVWDTLVKKALALGLQKAAEKVAFLAWGPVAALIGHYVMKYADLLYGLIKEYLVLELIAFKNKEMHAKYVIAAVNLRITAQTHGINSPEFKEQRDADKKALSDLVLVSVA